MGVAAASAWVWLQQVQLHSVLVQLWAIMWERQAGANSSLLYSCKTQQKAAGAGRHSAFCRMSLWISTATNLRMLASVSLFDRLNLVLQQPRVTKWWQQQGSASTTAAHLCSTCMSHLILACVTAFSMSDLTGDHSG